MKIVFNLKRFLFLHEDQGHNQTVICRYMKLLLYIHVNRNTHEYRLHNI